MASVHEQETYDTDPDALWQRIGDFHGLSEWHPGLASQESLEAGKVRRLHLPDGGVIDETLLEQTDRSYTYSIDDSPLPVQTDYRATIAVREGDDGGAAIDWTADFTAAGASDEEAEEVIAGIFRAGLDALK